MKSYFALFVFLGVVALGFSAIVQFNRSNKCFKVSKPTANDDKVKLSLYFESLCPGCHEFIVGQLAPVFLTEGVSDILDVEVVPYGNAEYEKHGDKYTFTCQHGEGECQGNKLLACVVSLYSEQETQIKFLQCAEESGDPQNSGEKCSGVAETDWNRINDCYTSDEGDNYVYNMAVKTDALTPSHEYVPWIVINGVHDESQEEQATEDLLTLVCSLYQGTTKPAACPQ